MAASLAKKAAHRGSPEERFWWGVADGPDGPDGCWLWIGACNRKGYGAFHVRGRVVAVHRFSYELHCGPIPPGMVIMHTCDVPACVRPDHLRLGTQSDNLVDALRKGRLPSKLTEAQVLAIRARYASGGISQYQLADEYGVCQAVVKDITMRKSWRHVA